MQTVMLVIHIFIRADHFCNFFLLMFIFDILKSVNLVPPLKLKAVTFLGNIVLSPLTVN